MKNRLISREASKILELISAIGFSTVLSTTLLFSENSFTKIVSASTPQTSSSLANLSGTLTYPSTTRLPPDAVAYVTLVDVSPRQDASGGMIARETLSNLGSAPVSFKMNYDHEKICADCSYAIQAQIVVKGKVLFRNASAYPVLTRGNPSIVNILLKPV